MLCQGRFQSHGAVMHVLNGKYPAAAVKKMSRSSLEALVTKLVQCTADVVGVRGVCENRPRRPKWWPSELVFSTPIDLGLESDYAARMALKQLVISCSRFFKGYVFESRWRIERGVLKENDENRSGLKRGRPDSAPKKPLKMAAAPPTPGPELPTKDEFLQYFELDRVESRGRARGAPAGAMTSAKLASCVNIPFSSDMGRAMAARESHRMPEELKLRRLEKSEWYTNKSTAKAADVGYEQAAYKRPVHSHTYKAPKRQQHHRRRSLHNAEFLARFCRPLSVRLQRLDLEKVKSEHRCAPRRELVVLVEDVTRLCRDAHQKQELSTSRGKLHILRTSPRLRGA